MSRLAELKAKLRSREGKEGFKRNVEVLREEIARLEGKGGY